VLVHKGKLILLDHEVIHFGDGAFDLGFSLTHFLSKAHHLRNHRSAFAQTADRYWNVYRDAIGDVPWADDLESRAVEHTIGCLLARCRGRSPLEYLSDDERSRQADAVVKMMKHPPQSVGDMVNEFLDRV
jgi:hypothetical protein